MSTAQIFYSPFAQPRQQDMKENSRSAVRPKIKCTQISFGIN